MKKLFIVLAAVAMLATPVAAQDTSLTKEKVMAMSVDELSELSLEDLMYAVELLDLKSVDELFSLLMNKNVSSASKKAEDAFKSPLSTSVLSREEIRSFGCSTVEEALRLMTGLIVREKTNGNYDVHLRGLDNIPDANMLLYSENVNTLLMINGRPVFNYATGATMWESLPVGIEDIARIEVVRGPSSALYGSNAVTGVINIITEKPTADSKSVQGSVQMGNYGSFTGDIAFRKAFTDKWAASLSANIQKRERPSRDIFLIPNAAIFDSSNPERSFAEGADVPVSDLVNLRQYGTDKETCMLTEASAPINGFFPTPETSRKGFGVNGALSFAPASDITFDLTAGYKDAEAITTSVGDHPFALNTHDSKQYYADLTSEIKGLSLQFNYTGGPLNYMVGTPGFKADSKQFTANVDYDWTFADKLTIRPGFNFRWNQIDPNKYNDNYGVDKYGSEIKLNSYFDNVVTLRAFAPSIRIDYSPIEQLRLVGAYRAEKLNLPDDVYHSWQAAATFSPSEKHNLRLIYSRANRSAIFTNTSSNFTQVRVGLPQPNEVSFLGNPDAKVMVADNYELGYRLRPTDNILIDAEVYYNRSRDYGALTSESANLLLSMDNLFSMFSQVQNAMPMIAPFLEQMMANPDMEIPEYIKAPVYAMAANSIVSKAYVQYQNLPYKVNQLGASLAMDWILSKNLVAKINLNYQNTTIDDYYTYNKAADMTAQFTTAAQYYEEAIIEFVTMFADPSKQDWLNEVFTYQPEPAQTQYDALCKPDGSRTPESEAFLQQFYNKEGITTYYSLKYGCDANEAMSYVTIGRSRAHQLHTNENGYKHKNTPSFYGSIGLLYKPIESLSIAAHSYFYSKQTMKTQYGEENIDGKFIMNLKVGYRPTEQFEVFFNAHNLFDSQKREFAYTDKTRGIYSLGVNFGF